MIIMRNYIRKKGRKERKKREKKKERERKKEKERRESERKKFSGLSCMHYGYIIQSINTNSGCLWISQCLNSSVYQLIIQSIVKE